MELGILEEKLRALPGVLDCSVSAEGVAVVVHPEVDPRLIEVHAQVLLAEAGDRRALLVVGGMTVGPRVLPSGRSSGGARRSRPERTGPSPLSLAGFALLVLALLAVVPIAGRESAPRGTGSSTAAGQSDRRAPTGLGRLPVDERPGSADEVALPLAGPALADAQLAAAVAPAAGPEDGTVARASIPAPPPPLPAAVPIAAEAPGSVPVPVPVSAPEAPEASKASKGSGLHKGNGKGHGHGGGRAGGVQAAGHRHEVVAGAGAHEHHGPGRRRGHRR